MCIRDRWNPDGPKSKFCDSLFVFSIHNQDTICQKAKTNTSRLLSGTVKSFDQSFHFLPKVRLTQFTYFISLIFKVKYLKRLTKGQYSCTIEHSHTPKWPPDFEIMSLLWHLWILHVPTCTCTWGQWKPFDGLFLPRGFTISWCLAMRLVKLHKGNQVLFQVLVP